MSQFSRPQDTEALEVNLMKSKRDLLTVALLALAALSVSAAAQNSRPRYSSARPVDQSSVVPTDTVISVQINGSLSSRTARVGDKFTATVMVPVYSNGRTVIPAGSIVEGRDSSYAGEKGEPIGHDRDRLRRFGVSRREPRGTGWQLDF